MFSDVPYYNDYGHLGYNAAEEFFSSVVKKMDWTNEEEDIVMDIGCGSGEFCPKTLLPAFPKIKKVIAIDIQQEMIELAQKCNAHEKIDYYLTDVEDEYSMKKWSTQISKVMSIYCFHWLHDIRNAFQNVYQVLKPGGEAGFIFILSTPFWNSCAELKQNPRWNKYLQDHKRCIPESHWKNQGPPHFRQMLTEIGFNVIICEDQNRVRTYLDEDDGRASCVRLTSFPNYIPEEKQSEFIDDLFRGFVECNGQSAHGKPMLCYRTLTVLIQKPRE